MSRWYFFSTSLCGLVSKKSPHYLLLLSQQLSIGGIWTGAWGRPLYVPLAFSWLEYIGIRCNFWPPSKICCPNQADNKTMLMAMYVSLKLKSKHTSIHEPYQLGRICRTFVDEKAQLCDSLGAPGERHHWNFKCYSFGILSNMELYSCHCKFFISDYAVISAACWSPF